MWETKAAFFQFAADELHGNLRRATLELTRAGKAGSIQHGAYFYSTPILRALAAECALKALSVNRTGKYLCGRHGHDLATLYVILPEDVKELVNSVAEEHGIAPLEAILKQHRDDFVDWRYPSANDAIRSSRGFADLQQAVEVLMKTLRDGRFRELCPRRSDVLDSDG